MIESHIKHKIKEAHYVFPMVSVSFSNPIQTQRVFLTNMSEHDMVYQSVTLRQLNS